MQQRTSFEPAKVTVCVARPVTSDHAIRAEIDDLMAIVGKQIERGGNECLVPVVIQLVDDAPVSLEACVRARHQFLDESSGREQYLAAEPSRILKVHTRYRFKIVDDTTVAICRELLVGNVKCAHTCRLTALQQFLKCAP